MDNNNITPKKSAAADFDSQLSDNNKASGYTFNSKSIITVIGVGGAGGNAVTHMLDMNIKGVNFVVCNTDAAALRNSKVENQLQLGEGHGAGNKPEVGRQLATEAEDQIRSLLKTSNTKMLFIAAGMGGGTGTGASPVIAKIAHDLNILTVAVVTMPFLMEGPKRFESAVAGVQELNKYVDSLLIIKNEDLKKEFGKLPIRQAFGKADDILGLATKGIAELITVEYALVRVDFSDVETVMRNSGRAHMSVGTASGEDRAIRVAENALKSSLLDAEQIRGAEEILLSFSVNDIDNLSHDTISETLTFFQNHAQYRDKNNKLKSANIIWGASEKEWLKEDELELVIVATSFEDGRDLKIQTVFNPDLENDPFGDKPQESVAGPTIRDVEKRIMQPRPNAIPTIAPASDKYRHVMQQQNIPAYNRQKALFHTESETQTKTVFRPLQHAEELPQEEPQADNNLFS